MKGNKLNQKDLSNLSVGSVVDILLKHDPIGINYGMDSDEYKPEAESILSRLNLNLSVEDIQNIVYDEFVKWFNANTAGDKSLYLAIAKDIFKSLHGKLSD